MESIPASSIPHFRWSESLREAVKKCTEKWATHLRRLERKPLVGGEADPAFYGEYSLLNQDQGIRALLHVTNDLCFFMSNLDHIQLEEWREEIDHHLSDQEQVQKSINNLQETNPSNNYISK